MCLSVCVSVCVCVCGARRLENKNYSGFQNNSEFVLTYADHPEPDFESNLKYTPHRSLLYSFIFYFLAIARK